MEATSATLMTFGLTALFASWVLLLIVAWKADYAWGLCALLLPPLAYIYALFRMEQTGQSLLLALIGWVLIWMA